MSGKTKSRSPKATRGHQSTSRSKLTTTSKSVSPPAEDGAEKPSGRVNFEFLNFSHPSDAKASGARRTVRSHVTRQQHQKEQQAAAAARRSKSVPKTAEASSDWRPPPLVTHLSFPSTDASYEQTSFQRLESEAAWSATSASASPIHSPMVTPPARVHPFDLYPPEWHESIPDVINYCE